MKQLLMVIVMIAMIMVISGCVKKKDIHEISYDTLTCSYEMITTKEDKTIVFTYSGDVMISIFVNDEELNTEEFFEGYTDVDAFLTDMVDWYTNSGLFDDATCVYDLSTE